MVSRPLYFVWPVAFAASLLCLSACAGSKSRSSSSNSSPAEEIKNQKLDEARRSAEEAELQAHQLRTDKSKSQSKSSSN